MKEMKEGKKDCGCFFRYKYHKNTEQCLNCRYSEKHPRKNIKVYKMVYRIKELKDKMVLARKMKGEKLKTPSEVENLYLL